MIDLNDADERRRSALTMLSAVGAALAGAGIGSMAPHLIGRLALPLIAVGLVSHLWGMVGTRVLQGKAQYRPPAWQVAGFWLCWLIIGLLIAAFVWQSLG